MRSSDDTTRHVLPFWGLPVDALWAIDPGPVDAPAARAALDAVAIDAPVPPAPTTLEDAPVGHVAPPGEPAWLPIAAAAPDLAPPHHIAAWSDLVTLPSASGGAPLARGATIASPPPPSSPPPVSGGGTPGVAGGATHPVHRAAEAHHGADEPGMRLPVGIDADLRIDQVVDVEQAARLELVLGGPSASGPLVARGVGARVVIDDDALTDQDVRVEIAGYGGPVDVRVVVDQRVDLAQDSAASFSLAPADGLHLDVMQLLRVWQHMDVDVRLAELDGVLRVDIALGEAVAIAQSTQVEIDDGLDGLALSLAQLVEVAQTGELDLAIEGGLAERYAIGVAAELHQELAVGQRADIADADGDGVPDLVLAQSVDVGDDLVLRIGFSGL